MKPRNLFLALAVLLLSSAVNLNMAQTMDMAPTSVERTKEVVIIHTNDMHSKIDNFGKLAYLADSLRKTHKYVFLLSAGDNFTGNPIVDMYPDKGFPMIDLMNMVHFDATVIGNHEFDMGQELQNKRRKQAEFPFICCNLESKSGVLEQPKPFVLLEAGSVTIPVLGIIQIGDNGFPDSHPSRMDGLEFTDGIAKASSFLWLKQQYGMLIGLTHLGVVGDEALAKAYPEFDLIIGGHSHTTLSKPMIVNGVTIVQTGSNMKNVGITTLKIEDGKVVDCKYDLVAFSSIHKSVPDVDEAIGKYNKNEELQRVVGIAESDFSTQEELGCMMTDAITARMKVDFAFQNKGGIRLSSIPKGDIKLMDIFQLDPFGNQVVTYKLTGLEIKSLIVNSYNRQKELDLIPSGMTYTAMVDNTGKCTDALMNDLKGNPIEMEKTYSVGANSYISASYKFEHRDGGTTSYNTSAQTLLDYLTEVKAVNYSGTKRVFEKK